MLAPSSSLSQRIPEFVKMSAERVVQKSQSLMADPGQSFSKMVKPAVAVATAATVVMTLAGSGTLSPPAHRANLSWAYMVRRGDTLSRISPSAWHEVAQENGLRNPNRIEVGQFLYVDVKQVTPRLRSFLLLRSQLEYLQRAKFHSRGYRMVAAKPNTPSRVQTHQAVPRPAQSHQSPQSPPQNTSQPPSGITSQPAASAQGYQGNGSNDIRSCFAAVDWSRAAQWATPNACYGAITYANPGNYAARPSWGWCNWAAEESHLNYQGYDVLHLAKHWDAPRIGAVVWFNPGVQGAGGAGHWANLVAIGPNGWGLVQEMNFTWRGGGFGHLDYRYIRLYAPGVAYLYA